jgi:hypothetical protein
MKYRQARRSPVGVSLLAIAVFQSANVYLTHRYREQAHSYTGKRFIAVPVSTVDTI